MSVYIYHRNFSFLKERGQLWQVADLQSSQLYIFFSAFNWELSRVLLLLMVSFLRNTDISIAFYWLTFKHYPIFTRWLINHSSRAFRHSLTPKCIGAIINTWSSIHRMVRKCWSIKGGVNVMHGVHNFKTDVSNVCCGYCWGSNFKSFTSFKECTMNSFSENL